jgi:hypothetical protein
MSDLLEPARPALIPVLDEDPSLAGDLPEEVLEQARMLALAPELRLDTGPWHPAAERAGDLGLLVVEGLVLRSARLIDHDCAELLGRGDLLRPWQAEHSAPFLAGDTRWDVLEPARLALLDRRFTAIAGRWPEIVCALAERAVRRSRDMGLVLAVAQIPKVEIRLLVLLWHLAERWGEPLAEGRLLTVRLTHDVLARMASARRPTTTLALNALSEKGLLDRRPDRLLVLRGRPPRQLSSLRRALG